jgi:hypothetical protein
MRYVVTTVCSLLLHAAAALWWRPYGNLVLAAGGLVEHNTDIAALPDLLLWGLSLTAPLALGLGLLLTHFLWARRLTSA